MPEVILFPDAAAIVIDWVRPQLVNYGYDITVASRVPNPKPTSFVTIRRGGGIRETLVSDAATLLIECWGGTEQRAMDIAQTVRALVFAMEGTVKSGVPIYRVQEFAGPALLPDSTTDNPRAVLTMQVQLRGAAA